VLTEPSHRIHSVACIGAISSVQDVHIVLLLPVLLLHYRRHVCMYVLPVLSATSFQRPDVLGSAVPSALHTQLLSFIASFNTDQVSCRLLFDGLVSSAFQFLLFLMEVTLCVTNAVLCVTSINSTDLIRMLPLAIDLVTKRTIASCCRDCLEISSQHLAPNHEQVCVVLDSGVGRHWFVGNDAEPCSPAHATAFSVSVLLLTTYFQSIDRPALVPSAHMS
jgi:hypothetical protein